MANRIKKILGSIISDRQSAFIEGRLLTDNALIAFEINHYMQRKRQGRTGVAGLKLDISKAYDRLEWSFVRNMMEKFGFSGVWIDRVMKFISSVSYSFLHNGEEFGCVIPARGLHQGDPISPYLYIMCVEGLSAIIRRNEEAGLIHGCRIARGAPSISHLLFADDCYLFFKATKAEASTLKRILQRYAQISGQVINYNKSSITFSSNTFTGDRQEVQEQLQVHENENPGKYLGLPMRVGQNKKAVFEFLVERVSSKLQAWGMGNISKAGKVTLLKSAAQTIPTFWMNLLLIPSDICDRIEKKMNSYWWGGRGEHGGIRWMSWDRLCQVKEVGGLGFRKLKEFNVAMLAKQAWRLINSSSPLVAAIMKARYFANTDFLNAELGSNPSFMWRSIMESQEIIKRGCRRKIGDGRDTNIWTSPWLPCLENGFLTSNAYVGLQDATVNGLMMEGQKKWDIEVLNDVCNERDRNLIQQIHVPRRNSMDSWYWLLDDKGEFSVKSCYRQLRGERESQDRGFWKKLWRLNLPGKIVNFLWRVCRNVLPTASELIKKGVQVQQLCSWCHLQVEDTVHTLFSCCFARELWSTVGLQEVVRVEEGMTGLQVLRHAFQCSNREQCIMLGVISWSLWVRRNEWVWNKKNMSVFGVRSMALNLMREWRNVNECGVGGVKQKQPSTKKWGRPPEGWIKINVDAASQGTTENIGVACVARDDRGRFLGARSSNCRGYTQIREAEAVGLRDALAWVQQWRTMNCIFELDAKLVVEAVYNNTGRSNFHSIIDDCVTLLQHFENVLVVYEHRSANNVAHMLARAAFSMTGHMEWFHTAPEFIRCNLISEES